MFPPSVSLQVVPVQAPEYDTNVEPEAGVEVSVTVVPELNRAEHVAPQLTPAGEVVTVPVPVPALMMVRETVDGDWSIVMVCVATGLTLPALSTARYVTVVLESTENGPE